MNISKFTQKSQEAVQLSQKIALENGNQQIDQEHLAAALMEVELCPVPKASQGLSEGLGKPQSPSFCRKVSKASLRPVRSLWT